VRPIKRKLSASARGRTECKVSFSEKLMIAIRAQIGDYITIKADEEREVITIKKYAYGDLPMEGNNARRF
jgi:hypothetical protein